MGSENPGGKKPLLLVDAYSQIYRGFYAVRALTNSRGMPSNAVFAMAKLLLKLEEEYSFWDGAFVFDKGKMEKRLALAPDYKANRPPMPEELKTQVPFIRDLIRAFGWNIIEQEGYEADDLMGGMAKLFTDRKVLLLSSDKDISQVIDREDRINMLVPAHDGKGFSIRSWEGTFQKFGVTPERIVDFLSLVGDSSDNIPGVPGVGPKTAAALIQEAGSIMEMLREPERIGKLSLREKVVSHRETLERNLRLVTLFTDLPPEAAIGNDSVKKAAPDKEAVSGIVREFELKSLAKDVEKLSSAPVTPSAPDLFSSSPLPEEERKENKGQEQLFFDF